MKLLKEKPFEKITVKDIVEDCGLTRNAFYYYYEDIYDILDAVFDREIKNMAERYLSEGVPWAELFVYSSRFLEENERLVRHLFKSLKRVHIEIYIDRAIRALFDSFTETSPFMKDVDPKDINLVRLFFQGAVKSIIEEWINNKDFVLSDEVKRISEILGAEIETMLLNAKKTPRKK